MTVLPGILSDLFLLHLKQQTQNKAMPSPLFRNTNICICFHCFCLSVTLSFLQLVLCSVMSDSLQPRGLYPASSSVCGIFQARIPEQVAFPTPGDLPDPGIKLASLVPPALAGIYYTTVPPLSLILRRNLKFVAKSSKYSKIEIST